MSPRNPPELSSQSQERPLRRHLVLVALIAFGLGVAHLADHALRGELVVTHGLDPAWNHSGWPFQASFTPFTVSAVLVPLLLLGGALLTLRRRAWAGYWLATAGGLGAFFVFVHFVPGHQTETPAVIFRTYTEGLEASTGVALGVAAVAVVVAVIAVVLVLIRAALRARRLSGRW